MTVKEIALAASEILQADDIYEIIDAAEGNITLDDIDANTMVRCVNLAVAETRSDFPVLEVKRVKAENGFIPLDAFDGAVSTVRKVSRNGRCVRFTLDTRGIGVPSCGEYDVVYTLAPTDCGVAGVLETGAGVDKEMLVYLAARNYCLVTGRSDEASVWDQRYAAEAENKRLARRAVLPERRFV